MNDISLISQEITEFSHAALPYHESPVVSVSHFWGWMHWYRAAAIHPLREEVDCWSQH